MNDKSKCEAEHTYEMIQIFLHLTVLHLTVLHRLAIIKLTAPQLLQRKCLTCWGHPSYPSYPSWDFRSTSNNVSAVIFVNFSPPEQSADGCVGWWRKMRSVIDWFDWCYKDNRYQLCVVVQLYCLASQYAVNRTQRVWTLHFILTQTNEANGVKYYNRELSVQYNYLLCRTSLFFPIQYRRREEVGVLGSNHIPRPPHSV